MSQQDEPRIPTLPRARPGGAADEAPSPSRSSKQILRPLASFNERAPPPWLIRAEKHKEAAEDDACSSADSVLSDYRDASGSEQMDAATTQSPASRLVSSSSEASQDTKKVSRMSSAKKEKERELPAVAGAEARRPASGSSNLDLRRSPSSSSPSKSAAATMQSRTDHEELPVSASTAGEWVNRLQALRDVAEEHFLCSRRMFSHVEDMLPEARDLPSATKSKILDVIFQQLELSRDLLERHAQGLIGTDLAELRMIQGESKRLDDKVARMNKLYAKEVKNLGDLLQKKKEAVERVVPPKSVYEPLMFMEPAERGCLLALLEEKLQALLEANPEIQPKVNQLELARLQDLFKKEQQSSLERQVAKLTEEEQAARKQIAVLEAYNEKLRRKIKEIDDGVDRGSEGSGSLGAKEAASMAPVPPPPAGKPKSGRPKRGATFTKAGSGQVGQAQATGMSETLRMPEGS